MSKQDKWRCHCHLPTNGRWLAFEQWNIFLFWVCSFGFSQNSTKVNKDLSLSVLENKMSDPESKSEEKKLIKIKNATDLQRLKLEKLMKNPVSASFFFSSAVWNPRLLTIVYFSG